MEWSELDNLIYELERMISSDRSIGAMSAQKSAALWKQTWEKAKIIQEGFKTVRYSTKEEQDFAWKKFNSLRDTASKLSKDERSERIRVSREHKTKILRQIQSARPAEGTEGEPTTADIMKSLGATLNTAGEKLHQYKNEMLGEDKQECFDAIRSTRLIHEAWWGSFKEERKKKKDEFKEVVRARLEKQRERLAHQNEALGRFRTHAEDLRQKIELSHNAEWVAKANVWLAEFDAKVSDIEKTIAKTHQQIKRDEKKAGKDETPDAKQENTTS